MGPLVTTRPGRPIRASDADRERTAALLRRHYAAGRLGEDELEERLARVYGARMRSELQRVVTDLPRDLRGRGWRGFYRFQREALRYHAAAYVGVNGSLAGIWALTGEGLFWPAWVLAPATVMLGWHAVASRMLRRSLQLDERRRRTSRAAG